MKSAYRWTIFVVFILTLILTPFFLFGEQVENWTDDFLDTASKYSLWVALILGGLLATDILVPVPSSLVSTAAGFFLGFAGGLATSLIGMTISCVLGYWLGAHFGRPLTSRLVGKKELAQLETITNEYGRWAVVIARPIPVLAEASILVAGVSRMERFEFYSLCLLSNLGISAVYAAVGSVSASTSVFLLAFAGAVLIPGVIMLATKKRLLAH